MSDLARLRRCARILRRAHPENKYRVSVEYQTIFQVGTMFGFPCEFSQSLAGWEAYAEKLLAVNQGDS